METPINKEQEEIKRTDLQVIEAVRKELLAMVNKKIDDLIQSCYGGSTEKIYENMEYKYSLRSNPYILKGKKPVAVEFPNGQRISTTKWRYAAEVILQYCNKDIECHEKFMQIRGRIAGKQRVLLGDRPEGMTLPIKIDEELYFEAKFDTETLFNVITKRILDAVGFNYSGIIIVYTEKDRRHT